MRERRRAFGMSRPVAVVATAILAVAAGLGGYAMGSATAPTEDEAVSARTEARTEALAQARADAHGEAMARGLHAGQAAGRQAGEIAGSEAGQVEGSDSADAELAAAEEAERAANCGAPLFVTGFCPTDEEIEAENNAESLCGGAHYEEAAAQGIDCGPIPSPRP